MIQLPKPLRVAYIASYPPRKCGIATYTKDLATGINSLNPDCLAEIIAMDDAISQDLHYQWEVSKRIRQDEWSDYEAVLTYLNRSVIDVVCLQHEYGIFGSNDGEKIVDFVTRLEKPFIVTFHSVLARPSQNQKQILEAVANKAQKVVVMLEASRDVICDVYGISPEKVVAIHHGAPDFAFESTEAAKKTLRLTDRIVMSSINLLGRGRGIEYAIQALPKVVKKYPNFLYLIIGQTHPSVLMHEGEAYRRELEALVATLGLQDNVKFINKYVSLDDLIRYVRASDMYVTPYENMETASSGSLAYAVAAGKLCISTPYKYALELFAGNRGLLVATKNPAGITQAIMKALADPVMADRIRAKCYQEGRKMTWARVGFRYLEVMREAVESEEVALVPRPTLDYLRYMTDEHGLVEHSEHDEKNHGEGYATDDQARGLMVAITHGDRELAERYLEFLESAEHNGLVYGDKTAALGWLKPASKGDKFGRMFLAACFTLRFGHTIAMRDRAEFLVRKLLPTAASIESPRALAHTLLGLSHLQLMEWTDLASERQATFDAATKVILSAVAKYRKTGWVWIEDVLTYDNARVPEALLTAGRVFERPDLVTHGLELLNFVLDQTFDERQNHFRFVGNQGWYKRGQTKALFDEQPIDAAATVTACVAAYHATHLSYYRHMAGKAFAWFHGENIHRQPLYREDRQSVYDGLTYCEVNLNQGAESIVEYLLAYDSYARLLSGDDSTYTLTPVGTALTGS